MSIEELDLSHDTRLTRELHQIDNPGVARGLGMLLMYMFTGKHSHHYVEDAYTRAKQRMALEVWHQAHDRAIKVGFESPKAVELADKESGRIESTSSYRIKVAKV